MSSQCVALCKNGRRCKNSSKCAVHRSEQPERPIDTYDCMVAERQYEAQAGPVYPYDEYSEYWDRMITDDIEYRRRMLCELEEVGQTNYKSWLTRGPVQEVERIIGPVSLTHIEMRDKVFYIFGDEHSLYEFDSIEDLFEMEDIDILEFLDLVLRTSPYPIDVIIEASTEDLLSEAKLVNRNEHGKIIGGRKHLEWLSREGNEDHLNIRRRFTDSANDKVMLEQVSDWLKECLVPSQRDQCRYPTRHRFHNNDFRRGLDWLIAAEGLLGQLPEINKNAWLQQVRLSEWKKILNAQFKIDAQLSKCDPDVAKIIRHCLEQRTKKGFEPIPGVDQKSLDLYFIEYMRRSSTFQAHMDAYTIARTMRSFKKRSKHSDTMRNIFMYAGHSHATNYVELLKLLGGALKTNVQADNKILDVRTLRPWILIPSKDQV